VEEELVNLGGVEEDVAEAHADEAEDLAEVADEAEDLAEVAEEDVVVDLAEVAEEDVAEAAAAEDVEEDRTKFLSNLTGIRDCTSHEEKTTNY